MKTDKISEERRQIAFKEGKRVERLVCPICLKSVYGLNEFRLADNPEVIQVRYCKGGRGIGGFYKNEAEGIHLNQIKEARPEIHRNLKEIIEKLTFLLQ